MGVIYRRSFCQPPVVYDSDAKRLRYVEVKCKGETGRKVERVKGKYVWRKIYFAIGGKS